MKYLVAVKFFDGTAEIVAFDTKVQRAAFIKDLKTKLSPYIESWATSEVEGE